MPQESLHFRCPFCGQHAPAERITAEGPFQFELFIKKLGGKKPLTDEEREAMRGWDFTPGSAPGMLDYSEVAMRDDMLEAYEKRKGEL